MKSPYCCVNIFPAGSLLLLMVCMGLFFLIDPAVAEITWSGDVDPADPASWTINGGTVAYVGKTGHGTVNITGGDAIASWNSYIGYEPGSTGEVTVSGTNSIWETGLDDSFIGYEGSGKLNIIDGGKVIITNTFGYIGYKPGSTGEVTVSGAGSEWVNNSNLVVGLEGSGRLNITNSGIVTVEGNTHLGLSSTINFDNGTLTAGGLSCGIDDLTGTGTINTGGLASDIDLVFDATHGLNQTFSLNKNPGQNITVNLNVINFPGYGVLGAGYSGVGTMSISDGRAIISGQGLIGYEAGSMGTVTVDGIGSTWTVGTLAVGMRGNGTLNITGGGRVLKDKYSIAFIGSSSGSRGVVTVSGAGSQLICSQIHFDGSGSGALNIRDDGLVVVDFLDLDSQAEINGFINMSTGGMLAILSGEYDRSASLAEFFKCAFYGNTDAIRYWDESIGNWTSITDATYGQDYTLDYITEGELAGYTMLTVTAVPEPTTLFVVGFGTAALLRRRRRA